MNDEELEKSLAQLYQDNVYLDYLVHSVELVESNMKTPPLKLSWIKRYLKEQKAIRDKKIRLLEEELKGE